jgi:L-asparaginase
MQNTNAVVVVLGMGGTIAGTSPVPGDDSLYVAAQLGVAELLAAVPGLGLPLECEQVAQLDSKDMDFVSWRRLAARAAHHLARPEVAGVVVTHGTDTLEETAYFLHRILAPAKPLVLTAAMRPATSHEADGPRNLGDAVALARHPDARGVLVTMAGSVFGALDVRKVHPARLDAFGAGDAGPLACWDGAGGSLRALRPWPAVVEVSACSDGLGRLPAEGAAWPRVDVVSSHAGVDGGVVRALRVDGVQGLVAACTGNGTLHRDLEAALLDAMAAGVLVLRSTQCTEGAVLGRPEDVLPSAGSLTPAKARIELMLRLMRGSGLQADPAP